MIIRKAIFLILFYALLGHSCERPIKLVTPISNEDRTLTAKRDVNHIRSESTVSKKFWVNTETERLAKPMPFFMITKPFESIELIKKSKEFLYEKFYAGQAILFKKVNRFKFPLFDSISFFSSQVKQVKSLLKPGDIILTFSSGYMGNFFIPGMFKHGIIYVGSPSEQQQAGLKSADIPVADRAVMAYNFPPAKFASSNEVDLIEALAEGVVFNSLENLLQTHINRLLVLRPLLTKEERLKQLMTVFEFLGDPYDFNFDFEDISSQCCTELIYRSLNKRGPIQFSLINRFGRETLIADDIIDYYFSKETTKPKAFDFVLIAVEAPNSEIHQAQILTGDNGKKTLRQIMQN